MTKITALYVRVSTDTQAEEGTSIIDQTEKLTMFAKINDWEPTRIYNDAGQSGSNMVRPAMESLKNDIEMGLIERVAVYKLDRLSRNVRDTVVFIDDFINKYGVELISLSENINTSTETGKLMVNMMSSFAQYELGAIRNRMFNGRIQRAKQGYWHGGTVVPFGYIYDRQQNLLLVDPLQSTIVKSIFDDYQKGISITKLRDKLNAEGHIGKEVPWSYRTVRQTLDNITYTGKVRFAGESYEGHHDALVTEKQYLAVQAELHRRQIYYAQTNNPRPFRAKYMLSGLLRTSKDGSTMSIYYNKLKNGKPHKLYYKWRPNNGASNSKKQDIGHNIRVEKDVIEQHVINEIVKLRKRKITATSEQHESNKANMTTNLKNAEKRKSRLLTLYLDGNIDKGEYVHQSEAIDKEIKYIQEQIKKSKNDKLNDADIEHINELIDLKKTIRKMSYDEQKIIVRGLIEQIVFDEDGQVTIYWRF